MLLILYGTLAPVGEIKSDLSISFLASIEDIDKAVHVFMFLVLGSFIKLSYPDKSYLLSGFILSIYGMLIEVLQYILPTGRSFEIYDWIADIIGIILGFVIVNICLSIVNEKSVRKCNDSF